MTYPKKRDLSFCEKCETLLGVFRFDKQERRVHFQPGVRVIIDYKKALAVYYCPTCGDVNFNSFVGRAKIINNSPDDTLLEELGLE